MITFISLLCWDILGGDFMKKIFKKCLVSLAVFAALFTIIAPTASAKTTYYGNGVSCNSKTKTCSVNWAKTVGCIGNISVASWAGATIGKC